MIFNLPPLLGLIPLFTYLVMSLLGKDLLLTSAISFVLAAILTGQNLVSIGGILSSALSSFVVLVGVIIMMGSGLGEVLKETGVASNLVHYTIGKVNIKTQKAALIFSFVFTALIVGLLGTLAGGVAVIAPVLIPIAATLGLYPGSLGLMMLCGGFIGMLGGPFTPTSVTIRELTHVTMSEYYLGMFIPFSIVVIVVCFIFAMRLQKKGGDGEIYTEEDKVAVDFTPTKEMNRGTIAFVVTMVALLGYGIANGAGASYAIVIMLCTTVIVGIASGNSFNKYAGMFATGAGRMFKVFLIFYLIGPLLDMISASGAYDAVVALVQPLFDTGSIVPFTLISSAIGIWGISGAAVAQAQLIYDLFYDIGVSLNVSPVIWGNIVMYGCILTSFAIPNPDVLGPMSLAHSTNIKICLKAGYVIIFTMMIILAIRAAFGG